MDLGDRQELMGRKNVRASKRAAGKLFQKARIPSTQLFGAV